jgi:DNA-binding XRE family transcriptional regulator
VPHLGGVAGGAVHCRECRRLVARGSAGFAANAPLYCLPCPARHPDAGFADRLKAHRIAARLTLDDLGKRVGIIKDTPGDYEPGRREPQWHEPVKPVEVPGLALVGGS